MDRRIALTGIKPTGTPHIGNYFGAIKPALRLRRSTRAGILLPIITPSTAKGTPNG